MHRTTVVSTLALALASRVAAQGIDHDDIAPNCRAVCSNIANVADECELQYNNVPNEDQQEQDCICNASGMDTLIPACEACQREYYGQDDDYDEIQQLLRRCNFESTTITGTMTEMWASAPSTVVTTTYTQTDNDDDDNDIDIETDTITSYMLTGVGAGPTTAAGGAETTNVAGTSPTDLAGSASDAVESAATTVTDVVETVTDAASSVVESATDVAAGSSEENGAQQQSGNFAPMITAAPVLAAAGVAAAVFGL